MITREQPVITEDELRTINGLVARCRHLEAEFLRTRQVTKGDELYTEIDGIRWTLRTMHGVDLTPFARKAVPDGKGAA